MEWRMKIDPPVEWMSLAQRRRLRRVSLGSYKKNKIDRIP
jgi:hypothetical protein